LTTPREEFSALAAALGFFTRLPLPASWFDNSDAKDDLARAAVWFPVAGLLIAIVPAVFFWYFSGMLPATIAAGLAIALGMLLTGALHEDGLADCLDGLGGGRDKTTILEIMRDSRIGIFGGSALVFSIGLRWAALASLAPTAGIAALLIAHLTGRGAMTTALAFSTYARKQGTGTIVASGISYQNWILTIVVCLILAIILGGLSGLFASLAGLVAAATFLLYFASKAGGYTGDALGGMEQIAEIVVLVFLAAAWKAV
jgi:adenosylcobinamide-GDP ribazoletransferase